LQGKITVYILGVIACQEKSEIGGNTMYRVLIVDDESAHRKGVIQLLNRIKPEYFLFEAKDGNMAELILGTADIDIILTDIRMPNKDGLEFLQDLHKANYNAKVIIITGHGQFDYAKRALSLGAFDFLLKPIDMKELQQALNNAESSIQARNVQQFTQTLGIDMLLGKLVKGKLEPHEKQQIEGIIPNNLPGFIIVLKIPPAITFSVDSDWGQLTKSALQQAIKPIGQCNIFQLLDGDVSLVGMVFINCKQHESDIKELINNVVKRLISRLPEGFKVGISLYSEHLYPHSEQAYAQASEALLMTFYSQEICEEYKARDQSDIQLLKILNDHESQLSNAIKYEDHSAVIEVLSIMFKKVSAYDKPNPNRLKELFLLTSLRLIYFLQGKNVIADYQKEMASYNQTILEASSLDSLRLAVEQSCLMLNDISKQSEQSDEAIALALNYLDEHFAEDISLSQLAEKFYFTASYFSIYFKKKTGQNFNPYLTSLRLDRACMYLRETSDKIGGISQKVGYNDSAYFGKIFKKKIGCSPEEYRKRNYKI
jgi:two-component system response regulator YesN